MKRRERKQTKRNRMGILSISAVVLMFLVVIGMKSIELQEKNKTYIEQETELTEQIDDETERKEELEAYEAYTQTTDYVVEIAKKKLGLVYPDEIIFKAEDNN